MTFEEFWLDLIPVDDEVRVSLHDSPSGEASPFNARLPAIEDIERLASAFEQVRGHRDYQLPTTPTASLDQRVRELGGQLSRAIFQGSVRDRWMSSRGRGMRPDGPLRLRLQMSIEGRGGARLHATPWECLHAPGDDQPAALDASFSLVRHVVAQGRDVAPPRPRPLVVLVVASQAPGLPPLDLDAEITALRRLEGPSLHLEVLDEPSLDSLRSRLAGPPVHVLHFLGHGGFDPVEERGAVFLPRSRGGAAVAVSGTRLASVLQSARALRLVFLNACRTAAAAEGSPFAGVATAIIRKAGVPAVLAMQYPIPDRSAILFAHEVYGRLAAGEGLDAAVTEGRRQLYHDQQSAWVVPVLFSRQRGELFAVPRDVPVRQPRSPGWWRRGLVAVMVGGLLAAGGAAAWLWPEPELVLEPVEQPVEEPVEEPVEKLVGAKPDTPDGHSTDDGGDSTGEEGEVDEPPPEPTPVEKTTSPDEPQPSHPTVVRSEPPPEPAADSPLQLSCGQSVFFARADAYVGCTRQQISGESYLSLTLRLAGKSYPARAVVGSAADVAFEGPPDAVVSVADVDVDAGRLTVFPPAVSTP